LPDILKRKLNRPRHKGFVHVSRSVSVPHRFLEKWGVFPWQKIESAWTRQPGLTRRGTET
jgi:hypothetical protein